MRAVRNTGLSDGGQDMATRRTKRTDGRYSVNFTYEDRDGIKRRAYAYGKTQAEAKANAEQKKADLAEFAPVRDASRTLSEWLGEWRESWLMASSRADSTKDNYATVLRKHV